MSVSRPATADDLLAAELLASAIWHAGRYGGSLSIERDGKRPSRVAVHGFKSAASVAEFIRAQRSGSHALDNVAIPTGYPGPDVLDVDVRADGSGFEAFGRLKRAGLLAGAHRMVATPSGGLHVYFAGTTQRSGSLKAEHLDFKSVGGYILVPPLRVGGRPYVVVDNRPPTGATFDWEAAKRLLCPPRAIPVRIPGTRRGGSVAHLPGWLAQQPEGNRNASLFWAACRAAETGDQDVLAGLIGAAVQVGLSEDEAQRTVTSAVRTVDGGR